MYQWNVADCRLCAGKSARLADHHVCRFHIEVHICRKRYGTNALIRLLQRIQFLLQRYVAPGKNENDAVARILFQNFPTQIHDISGARSSATNQIYPTVLRNIEHLPRRRLSDAMMEFFAHRNSFATNLLGRQPAPNRRRDQFLMRQKIAIQIGIAEKRRHGIVGQDPESRNRQFSFAPERVASLHAEEMGANHGVKLLFTNIIAQLFCGKRARNPKRRRQFRTIIEIAYMVDRAKYKRRNTDRRIIPKRD